MLAAAGAAAGGLWSGGRTPRRVAAALCCGVFGVLAYAAGLGLVALALNSYLE